MQFPYFSCNGKILPSIKASIPLSNIAYSYGFGVYETLKVRKGILYFIDQHVDRLFHSTNIIGLHHSLTKQKVTGYLSDLLEALELPDLKESCNIKMLMIGGEEPLFFILALPPLFPHRKLYSQGTKTLTVHYERLFPNAKTLNMLGSYLAYKRAQQEGCYDALLVDRQGDILEGTRTNFFTVKDMVIFSAPVDKILEGVTRMTILSVAKKMGFTLRDAAIPLSSLHEYDGAFITSTSTKIMPIRQVDDFIFPEIPEKVRNLMKAYDIFLDECKGIFK
jgi:branched-chain amino acid aminotransferase